MKTMALLSDRSKKKSGLQKKKSNTRFVSLPLDNPLQHSQELGWILASSTCCCLAWAGHTWLTLQERHRPRFSDPLRLFWIASFILSTVAFSLWIRNGSNASLYWNEPIAMTTSITTVARFAANLLLVLLGAFQEFQTRFQYPSSQEPEQGASSPSPHPSNVTLVHDSTQGRGSGTDKKGKQKKKLSATGLSASQKDYKRPTTFKEFYEHCKHLRPYVWPANSRKLQIHILLCLVLLVAGRVVNVLVPQQVANVVDALTMVENESPGGLDENGNRRFIWKEIMIFIALRSLQGSIGAVDTLQTVLWIPVGQFNTRELAVKMFEHLLTLSLRFHLNRKTGEMLRVQGNGRKKAMTE